MNGVIIHFRKLQITPLFRKQDSINNAKGPTSFSTPYLHLRQSRVLLIYHFQEIAEPFYTREEVGILFSSASEEIPSSHSVPFFKEHIPLSLGTNNKISFQRAAGISQLKQQHLFLGQGKELNH
ncbi:hypothetical protein TNCV_1360371 [Trichonephila clavipes]|nr:hypothetical protein TNCV_1360371 [Trichonephila clavipes]